MRTVTTPIGSGDTLWILQVGLSFSGNGPKADAFAKYLENQETLLLSHHLVYEVYKKMLREQTWRLAEKFLSTASAFST